MSEISDKISQAWAALEKTTITGKEYVRRGKPDSGYWGTARSLLDEAKKLADTPPPTPTSIPTSIATSVPTSVPTSIPTSVPTFIATSMPTVIATSIPTSLPTSMPTSTPTYAAAVFADMPGAYWNWS